MLSDALMPILLVPRPSTGMVVPTGLGALPQLAEPATRYTGGGLPKGAVIVTGLVLLYLLPTMLAFVKGVRRRWKVAAVNVLLGWTLVGWVAAMAMTWAYEAPADP